MRAGRRFGPLLRCKGVVAAGLTALPALFALSTGTPAIAATSAHQKPKPPVRYVQVSNSATCAPDSFCTVTATCPSGNVVTGGGITADNFVSSGVYVYETQPTSATTWRGTIRNASAITFHVSTKAVCARRPGVKHHF
ncbi:hypothetical protein [Streptomyces mirabilis]|uniref:hypothetical protein n=1 Tax=Streptomyces mirabilis TaxID=68239 RepID=UPI0033B6F4FD